MGEVTSKVNLEVSVDWGDLKEAKEALEELESAAGKGINIKFNSKDLDKIEKSLDQMNSKLGKIVNNTDLSKMFDSLYEGLHNNISKITSDLNDLADGKDVNLPELESLLQDSLGTIDKYLSGNVGTSKSGSNKSLTKDLDKEVKNAQKTATSLKTVQNKLNDWAATDKFAQRTAEMNDAIKEYNGIESEHYQIMLKCRDEYKKASEDVLNWTGNGKKSIEATKENAEQLISAYKTLDQNSKKFNTNLGMTKIDAKNNGFKTLTENAKEAAKETQKANEEVKKSVQSMLDATRNSEKTLSDANKGISPYKNFNANDYTNAADSINQLSDSISNFKGVVGNVSASTTVDDALNKLTGAGYNSDAINDMAKQMTDVLPKAISDYTKKLNTEYGDLAKAQENFTNLMTKGTLQGNVDKISKNLGGFQSLTDLQAVNEQLEQQAHYYDLLASARANMTQNGGSLNAQQFMQDNNLSVEQFEKLPKLIQDTATASKELNTQLTQKGIDASNIGKITSGEMANTLNNLEKDFAGVSDSAAKANFNGIAKELEGLYGTAQSGVASGTVEGFAQASQAADEFTRKAEEAANAYRQFASGGLLGSGNGGGSGGIGGGGGTGNWFGGGDFWAGMSSSFNSAAQMLNRVAGYGAIYREARKAAKEMVDTVTEIDTAMNQLQIVTGASDSQMNTFFESSISQAKELGQSVTDVLDEIQVYSRLGYNLEEASELAEYTSILSNVAAVDVEDATTGLTSVIKGFDMDVSEAEHVSDVLIDIGQNYAVSASEILEAFQHSSAAFGATGTTFEEAAAIIAAGNAAVQDASLQTGLEVIEIYLNRMPLIARTA